MTAKNARHFLKSGQYSYFGVVLLVYAAELRKPTGIFEKAYRIEEGKRIGKIFIKNTPGGKKKFRSRVNSNVLFKSEILSDDILGENLTRATGDTKSLVLPHIRTLVEETMRFCRITSPPAELALFCRNGWEKYAPLAAEYARLITVVGRSGENVNFMGAPVRFVVKLRRLPTMALIIDEDAHLSPILGVPTVDLRLRPSLGKYVLSKESVAFFVPEELKELPVSSLNPDTAAYFIEHGYKFSPQLMSLGKKSESFFTFG